MTTEPLSIQATFFPNEGDEANGLATMTVEIIHRISAVIPTRSDIPEAMNALRLEAVKQPHVLEALNIGRQCTVNGVTTSDNLIAVGFKGSN